MHLTKETCEILFEVTLFSRLVLDFRYVVKVCVCTLQIRSRCLRSVPVDVGVSRRARVVVRVNVGCQFGRFVRRLILMVPFPPWTAVDSE